MKTILILGNQLFDPRYLKDKAPKEYLVFMREDNELASYFKFHQQKIAFFFAAMRHYKTELERAGYNVHYEEYKTTNSKNYDEALAHFIKKNKVDEICLFEIEDKFFEKRIFEIIRKTQLKSEILPSPMFLTSRQQFKDYLGNKKKLFMKTFYERQRKQLNILMNGPEPVGGQWSYDTENRKALPKGLKTPPLPATELSGEAKNVIKLVSQEFKSHPGKAEDLWLPTDREGARLWLKDFLQKRLKDFGPYEDALAPDSEFVYHSVLTPFLNCGLLTPRQIIAETLRHAEKKDIPLASLEGFIRQIIGWREFIRGIYQNFSEAQESTNYWQHKNKLKKIWYEGKTGIPALDRALEKVLSRGYNHHIERLMVIGNLMVLLEVNPQEAHRWFMEMYIDSSDWVMGPNVYGMALFSDGGIFATKPYICGSNYLRKMSGDKPGPWCDGVDGLYWGFIIKHKDFFLKNPRLSMMARTAEKMDPTKLKRLSKAADELRAQLVEVIK